jgi:oxygen-independent coproporphyrinogen-3 oxidase
MIKKRGARQLKENPAQPQYGLYIHVPFCDGKCPYCDFYSVAGAPERMDRYTEAVLRSITLFPEKFEADTLYFGGGTPSLLGAGRLLSILEAAARHFSLTAAAEITVEANPGSVDFALLSALRGGGVNRLSLGVQAPADETLALLGRRHSAKDALLAAETASRAGFHNLSVDLMLALPGQRPEDMGEAARFADDLGACHLSAYLLKVEPGTPFARRGFSVDEEQSAAIYLEAVRQFEARGFVQYEISNFARDGRVSRHNLKYWNCEPYLGLGPSAHSFCDRRRFFMPRDLTAFCSAADPLALAVDDGPGGGFEEYAMLRLRLTEGLDTKLCARRFGVSYRALFKNARPRDAAGLLRTAKGVIRLTPDGFIVSNAVIGRLLY